MNHADILKSIDNIDITLSESSIAVYDAMLDMYTKADTILENYSGDDLSAFSIFQEGEILDKATGKGTNDSIIKKIALFIPRLVLAICNAIVKSFSHNDTKVTIIPKDKIKKAKKEPGRIRKFFQSKPMKTIALISSTAAVIELKDFASDKIKLIKQVRSNIKEIENSTKRKEIYDTFAKEYKPLFGVSINNDELYIQTNFDIGKIDEVATIYFTNLDKMLRRYFVDLRACKDLAAVNGIFVSIEKDLTRDTFIFEYLTGYGMSSTDEIKLSNPIKFSDIREKFTNTSKLWTTGLNEKITTILNEFVEAIPYDKFNNIPLPGSFNKKYEESLNVQLQSIANHIKDDFTVLSNIISKVRFDMDTVVQQILNIDVSTKEGKDEMKKVASGKYKFEQTDDGSVKRKEDTNKDTSKNEDKQ